MHKITPTEVISYGKFSSLPATLIIATCLMGSCQKGCSHIEKEKPIASQSTTIKETSSPQLAVATAQPDPHAQPKTSAPMPAEGRWESDSGDCKRGDPSGMSIQTYLFDGHEIEYSLEDYAYPGCQKLINKTRMVGSYTLNGEEPQAMLNGKIVTGAQKLDIIWQNTYMMTNDANLAAKFKGAPGFSESCGATIEQGHEISLNECVPAASPRGIRQFTVLLIKNNELFIGGGKRTPAHNGSKAEHRLIEFSAQDPVFHRRDVP